MPLLGFLGAALPWFSKALFSSGSHGGFLKQLEGLAYNVASSNGPDAFKHLLSDPQKLLDFQTHAYAMQQAYAKHICQDRMNARKRDMLFIQKNGSNYRADRMIYIACFGLFACIAALWVCRKALSVELVSIISALIGVFGSCLKDAYVFEFGSGKLQWQNRQKQAQQSPRMLEEFEPEEAA